MLGLAPPVYIRGEYVCSPLCEISREGRRGSYGPDDGPTAMISCRFFFNVPPAGAPSREIMVGELPGGGGWSAAGQGSESASHTLIGSQLKTAEAYPHTTPLGHVDVPFQRVAFSTGFPAAWTNSVAPEKESPANRKRSSTALCTGVPAYVQIRRGFARTGTRSLWG